ncbi:hypothetical protein F5Y17DRAFT_429415 [Xylariaceae sp. FL0594]|nr:hypothetical protein F5Y17DRAFT_429415 [Xylariaceae sp. FL0594]
MDPMRGTPPPKTVDSPEHLMAAFKAAALSVTKLYKTSAAAQAKSRTDGYQDCLDDLLAYLDKQNIGLCDGEGWQIRKWATERLDGRDSAHQITDDDEDDADKPEIASSPEISRASAASTVSCEPAPIRNEASLPASQAPPAHPTPETPSAGQSMITVPTQEHFTFQSSHPYPSDTYMNLANLDLSDQIRSNDGTTQGSPAASCSHATKTRKDRRCLRPRTTATTSGHLGRGAGQKRPINLAEIFDVGGVNFGKDVFDRDVKRSRHT